MKKAIFVILIAAAGAALFGACSAGRAKDLETARQHMREIQDAKAKMLGTMAEGGCGVVCRKQQEVCLSKNEICDIAQKYAGDEEFAKLCGDASADCSLSQAKCNGCRATKDF